MRNRRGSILVEDARILTHRAFPGYQHVMRVEAPEIAAVARPGSFVHVRCDTGLPMRRPLSIMRVSAEESWMELLYKQVGAGTRALASRVPGEELDMLGPIGVPFSLDSQRTRPLLLGGGVGIPPIIFLADTLRTRLNEMDPLVVMGSEAPFPFELGRASSRLPGVPAGVDATLAMVDGWEIPSRLASLAGYDGCFDGYLTDLARDWMSALSPAEREEVAIYACGPTPMLRAAARLAASFSVPCQVCLEEFMACAVGGCAGCAVRVRTSQGDTMRRVCVDGPVFDACHVFPPEHPR